MTYKSKCPQLQFSDISTLLCSAHFYTLAPPINGCSHRCELMHCATTIADKSMLPSFRGGPGAEMRDFHPADPGSIPGTGRNFHHVRMTRGTGNWAGGASSSAAEGCCGRPASWQVLCRQGVDPCPLAGAPLPRIVTLGWPDGLFAVWPTPILIGPYFIYFLHIHSVA